MLRRWKTTAQTRHTLWFCNAIKWNEFLRSVNQNVQNGVRSLNERMVLWNGSRNIYEKMAAVGYISFHIESMYLMRTMITLIEYLTPNSIGEQTNHTEF